MSKVITSDLISRCEALHTFCYSLRELHKAQKEERQALYESSRELSQASRQLRDKISIDFVRLDLTQTTAE